MRCVGLVLVLCALGFAQGKATIVGKVVDENGKPVACATVATFWVEGKPFGGTQTDEAGKFTLDVDDRGRPVVIMVKDKARERGVATRFSKESFGKERTLELEKLVTIKGTFTCSELKTPPPWTNIYLNYLPGKLRLARFMSENADFEFKVPEGDYEFYAYGTDVKRKTFGQFIEEDTDFGKVDLPATEIAKLYGKKPPAWSVTAARGVKRDVQLKDYRGKYLLIEFWGFW